MKRKLFLFLCCGAIGLAVNSAVVLANVNGWRVEKTSLPHGVDVIVFQGDLLLSSGPDAINAGIGEDAIYIEFNQNLGNVTISLYGESGALVYNAVVNTGVQQLVIIPINNDPGVSYTLELNNAAGYAEGFIDR